MKTFREFVFEAKDAVKDATYTGDAAEQERIRKRELKRGFDPDKQKAQSREAAKKAREEFLRNKSKNTKVPGDNIRGKSQTPSQPSGATQQTKTPPKASQTPPPNTPKSSTPPKAGPLSQTSKPPASTSKPPASTSKPPAPKGSPKGFKVPKGSSVLGGVIDTAAEKSSGSGWARSLAKGATTALGTAAGGALGSAVAPGAGTFVGATAGGMAASKAFDTVAGANAVGRKAIATANRQSQSGGGLKGIGGKTTFSKGKNGTGFMSTGSGSQRKTVQLDKTSVVNDPTTGKKEVGYLAYKDGKAVYKRPEAKSLAQTSSNPLERVGRSLFADKYKQNDAKLAAAKLKTAATSDIKRQQSLEVKGSKNLVGPKIVGPKIVGPKPTPSKPAGGGMAGARGSGSSPGSLNPKK
jgi:hypothetical protein